MNQRVLLVGDDAAVLNTRALLLQPLEAVKSTSSEAETILFTRSFDVVVICQSVAGANAEWIIAAAKGLKHPPAIIVIRFPNESLAVDVEVHETNSWKDAGWLKERVVELISKHNR